MTSKHLINDADNVVLDALKGLVYANPQIRLLESSKVVVLREIPAQIALISGGGSGHEPSHAGYVGKGLLTAAVCGSVFASPSSKQILAAIEACIQGGAKGVLLIVKNYTGDVLNFGLAVEKARAIHPSFPLDVVVVTDDASIGREKAGLVGRRGLAGTVLVHKLAGYLASNGADLATIKTKTTQLINGMATVGIGLEHCHVPGAGPSQSSLKSNDVEVGMGIHNEEGHTTIKLTTARELVQQQLLPILLSEDKDRSYLSLNANEDYVLLVNNLGGLSELELSVVLKEAVEGLESAGKAAPKAMMSGTYMTSLGMPGVSITIAKSNKELLEALSYPVSTPGWKFGAALQGIGSQSKETESTPQATKSSGKIKVDAATLQKMVDNACKDLFANVNEITRLDTVAGDGDCGTTLKRGAEGVQAISQTSDGDLVSFLMDVAGVAEEKMGGTSGALYSIFFNALASAAQNESGKVDKAFWTSVLKVAVDTLQTYTPARKGDRTLMDALLPFVDGFKNGDLVSASKAAREGAEATQTMGAKFGRASYVGEESQKVMDAGALGVTCIVEGLSR